MSRQIFANQADGFTSGDITLDYSADGFATADLAITFNAAGGTVNILVESSNGTFNSYPELSFTESTYGLITLSTSNKVRVEVTDGATDVTVEI